MKKKILSIVFSAMIMTCALHESIPAEAASFKNTVIKLRSPYQDCMNHSMSDRYNYNNDRHDYLTPYDADTDKVTSRTGRSLTIHWYPVYGASGYDIVTNRGRLVKRVGGMDTNQTVITGLKERHGYILRVRAYKKRGKKYTYSRYSAAAYGSTGYQIKGRSTVSAAAMARYYRSKRKVYPSVYRKLGAPTIGDFTRIVYREAARYNIRAEVLFAQICNETGFLRFGGDVSVSQCNFGGVGATGNGAAGINFASYAAAHYRAFGFRSASQARRNAVSVGVRSQAMHLALYAGAIRRINNTIDPRGKYVRIGNAPYVEWLGIRDNPYTTGEKHSPGYRAQTRGWASANNYGYTLLSSINAMKKA